MKKLVAILACIISPFLFAGELSRDQIKGVYHLGIPERGKNIVEIDFGQLGNKTILAVACKGCPPATYSFLQEESSTLQVTTFYNSMGLYVFKYDDEFGALCLAEKVAVRMSPAGGRWCGG